MATKFIVSPFGIIYCALILISCKETPTKQPPSPRTVAVQQLKQATGSLETALVGRVYAHGSDAGATSGVTRESNYRVRVKIPAGAVPDLIPGSFVHLTLPIVHDQETSATVESVGPQEISLLLARQIQELNGQEIRVQVPLKKKGVFRVPFDAIYSPRGITTQLFVLQNNRVEARSIDVVALAGPAHVYITGKLVDGAQFVVEGLDNLLSGDVVQVARADGGAP